MSPLQDYDDAYQLPDDTICYADTSFLVAGMNPAVSGSRFAPDCQALLNHLLKRGFVFSSPLAVDEIQSAFRAHVLANFKKANGSSLKFKDILIQNPQLMFQITQSSLTVVNALNSNPRFLGFDYGIRTTEELMKAMQEGCIHNIEGRDMQHLHSAIKEGAVDFITNDGDYTRYNVPGVNIYLPKGMVTNNSAPITNASTLIIPKSIKTSN